MSEQEQEQIEEQEPTGEETPVAPPEPTEPPEEEDGQAEEEEAAEPPPDESVPDTGPQSEKDIEARYGKLEKESKRHRNRLAEILQEDILSLVPCPLCLPDHDGWFAPAAVPEQVKAQVRIAIGDREPENWQADPHANRCESCDGYGEVLTGSRKAGQEVAHCVDCGGKGWTGDRVAAGASYTAPSVRVPASNGESVDAPSGPEPAEVAKLRSEGYTVFRSPVVP